MAITNASQTARVEFRRNEIAVGFGRLENHPGSFIADQFSMVCSISAFRSNGSSLARANMGRGYHALGRASSQSVKTVGALEKRSNPKAGKAGARIPAWAISTGGNRAYQAGEGRGYLLDYPALLW